MKKIAILLSSLLLTFTMQAQDRPQPKPGPAPKINIGKPQSFELSNGLKVLVVENNKLPRVSYSLTIDNPPYAEGVKKGVSDMTSSIMGNGTKTISKEAFNEETDFLGASINFSSNGAFASGLSKYSKRILELMADGALNPLFTQEQFDKEKERFLEGLKSQEKSVPSIARRVEEALTYGKSHPNGEFVTEETINAITLADVTNNYSTYFKPGNAYLVVVGDVKFKEVKKSVTKLFSKWGKGTVPAQTIVDPTDVAKTQINFIDAPNAVQSEISINNIVKLKMTDADYFAVILANQILGGDFNSYLNMNLREANGWTYGARSSIRGSKYTTNFRASTQVRNAVTDSAVVEFMKEIKRIRTEKVTDDVLKNVKAGYIGNFVMQIEKPTTVARYALQSRTQNLPADFYENYIQNINAVTADDILRVSQKYFLDQNLRIVIVGKATDVLAGLEALKMPMTYYDKYANQVEKPVIKKDIPAGVTVKTVLDNYINAVGGQTNVSTVKTIASKGTTTVPGAPGPITYTSKVDASGKLAIELAMGSMSVMKQVVNGNTGYMAQQGQKMELQGEMLEDMKAGAHPFPELTMATKTGVVLKGIETIDGADAYAIVDGKKTSYFDVKSGLKVADVTSTPQGDSTTNYKDYRDVKGVKVPFNTIMNVGFELNIKMDEIKVNEGVTDADFK
ncbi:M16 family metallopeptidase [Flavobacterium sp.]|jgi:zinc protease|uniref:M16 family metallopeptidase n=1 Tax=Flavobacterium sp. TaxID=239 RepID=UPI0037C156A8